MHDSICVFEYRNKGLYIVVGKDAQISVKPYRVFGQQTEASTLKKANCSAME